MKQYISKDLEAFLTPRRDAATGALLEEPLDQPLYHIRSYPTTGALSFTFFNQSIGDVGLPYTNMDSNSELSKGKRQAVFSIAVAFLAGGSPAEINAAAVKPYINDAAAVLEGLSSLSVVVLEKTYLVETPLTRMPAGMGLFVGAGGIQLNQTAAADKQNAVTHAVNGFPIPTARRVLRVPIPIPAQTKFSVTITFPALVTVQTAGRLGIWLDGVQLRALQ